LELRSPPIVNLEYHVKGAQKYGAGESMIQEAVDVGQMVKKGAMRKFKEFIPQY
jgi:hypothetical protein